MSVSVKSDWRQLNTKQPYAFPVIASHPYPARYRTRTLNSVYLLRKKAETTLKKKLG